MADKNRPLHILKYLWDHTDEEHPAIITDILAHLEGCGIHTNRKTVASDLADLQDSGFDVVCNKSRQNKYFIGNRSLELAELKMIVDADAGGGEYRPQDRRHGRQNARGKANTQAEHKHARKRNVRADRATSRARPEKDTQIRNRMRVSNKRSPLGR